MEQEFVSQIKSDSKYANRYHVIFEPLDDAEIHFSHTPLVFLSIEFGITGYYDPGRLRHAGSQDTNLPSHAPISTFRCIV